MTKTILSIDLGTTWVKLLKTQIALRSEAILDYKLIRVYPEDTYGQIASKIRNIIEQNQLYADQNLLAISSNNALYQELTFPFTQQNKIKQVLPFELEANLPVNIADYIWDYFLSYSESKKCKAFCFLQNKSFLRELIDSFEENQIILQRIDLDLTAFAGFATLIANKNELSAFLDLGWNKTNLAFVQNSQLQFMRTIPLGVGDILGEIKSETDAEQIQDLENLFSELLQEKNDISNLSNSYKELTKQIKLSFMQEDLTDVQMNIYPTGGASSLPSFCALLSRDCNLDLSRKKLPVPNSLRFQEPGTTSILFTTLGLHRTQLKTGLNFRQGELALHEYESWWKPHLKYGLVSLGLILLTWGFSFGSKIYFQEKKLNKLQTQIEETFQDVVPGTHKNLNPLQYPSILRSRIKALQSGSVTKDVPPVKTIILLSSISKQLPKDLQLQIELFSLDAQTLNLSGSASDYKTVNQIKNHLKELKYLSEIKIVGANVNKGGKEVNFNIRSTIQEK